MMSCQKEHQFYPTIISSTQAVFTPKLKKKQTVNVKLFAPNLDVCKLRES